MTQGDREKRKSEKQTAGKDKVETKQEQGSSHQFGKVTFYGKQNHLITSRDLTSKLAMLTAGPQEATAVVQS